MSPNLEEKNAAKLKPLLSECAVLFKTNGDFPLDQPGKIALYGRGVRHTIKGGTGSGEVNSAHFDTIEEAFQKSGFEITTPAWLDGYEKVIEKAFEKFKEELKAKAKKEHQNVMVLALGATMDEPEYELPLDGEGDLAIYVLSRISGEGGDRRWVKGDILLTDTEIRDILLLNEKYAKFMLVLNVGGMVDLSPVLGVKNILLLSQLGVETSSSLVRILMGKDAPSGRLSTTWVSQSQRSSLLEYGEISDTHYREGIYVGYRYYDTLRKDVLFPFGYGLSFTSFEITGVEVSIEGPIVRADFKVKNTGNHSGKGVVEAYLSCPEGKLDKPALGLVSFRKSPLLAPGEENEESLFFDLRDSSSYDEKTASYLLEKGDYILRLGNNSRDNQAVCHLHLSDDSAVYRSKNRFGQTDFADFVPPKADAQEATDLPVLEIKPSALKADPLPPEEKNIPAEVKALNDEDLLRLTNGYIGSGFFASMAGAQSVTVAGAAGESAHLPGWRPLVMADGGSGLRLAIDYFTDKKGVHSLAAPFPESLKPFMGKGMEFFVNHFLIQKPKKGTEIKHHYCTALPIGTAIAQSWNEEFANLCGDIVGEEMEAYGVDLWLSPSLNIQRAVECGRDFEYYSEDPYLSSHLSAAVAKGVQNHPGKGATFKHFAANNQEFMRTSNSSCISERALREIYLRNFQMAIRIAQPKAIMTSYNLINGIHACESKALLLDTLRQEWRYDGYVTTDWWIRGGMIPAGAKYPGPNPYKVIKAGGDVYMPGSKNDLKNGQDAFKRGDLKREDLEKAATHLFALIKD